METFIEAVGWVFFGACCFVFAAWIVAVILHYLNKWNIRKSHDDQKDGSER